jgi:hypothetical protein
VAVTPIATLNCLFILYSIIIAFIYILLGLQKTLVKVFYNSNAAMEDWHSIELPEVCPYHIRQLIDSCADPEPSKVGAPSPKPCVCVCVCVVHQATIDPC